MLRYTQSSTIECIHTVGVSAAITRYRARDGAGIGGRVIGNHRFDSCAIAMNHRSVSSNAVFGMESVDNRYIIGLDVASPGAATAVGD